MNASSTDSRRVCAFRLSCFVFCEITASLPSCRPSGRSFCILVPDTPGPEFVGNSRERARRSPARGFQRLQAPLGAAPKPTACPDFSTAKRKSRLRCPDFFTAKRESRPRRPDFFAAKRESRLRRWDFFTAKRESRPRRPDFFTAKRESRLRRPDFFTAKCESRPRRPEFATAKRESRPRRSPLPGPGLFRPRGRPERRASL